jgi:AcrR family transcriptional regulator
MDKENQSKEHILEQGFEALTREGIRFFTVESLAGKLGMSKKTIYKFFPTKEILIEKIVRFFTGMVKHKFQSVVESDENPIVKFNQVMDFIMDKISHISMDKAMDVKIRYPQVWHHIEQFRLDMRQYIAAIFKEAQKKGLAKSDMDMDVVATIYMNIVNYTFQPEFFLQNNLAPVDTICLFVRMVTEGLFTEKGLSVMKQNNKGTK